MDSLSVGRERPQHPRDGTVDVGDHQLVPRTLMNRARETARQKLHCLRAVTSFPLVNSSGGLHAPVTLLR